MNDITIRQQRTRKDLHEALIELIKIKGYHAVTVKDIVQHACYNRSTFYKHFLDKEDQAEQLLNEMLEGLELAVGVPYENGQKISTTNLKRPSFNIVSYIYECRNFFELLNSEDTLPALHTQLPLAISKIYKEQFYFETIDQMPVNMEIFKRYTAYGFYGIMAHWIETNFEKPEALLIEEIIELTKTHIQAFEYRGKN